MGPSRNFASRCVPNPSFPQAHINLSNALVQKSDARGAVRGGVAKRCDSRRRFRGAPHTGPGTGVCRRHQRRRLRSCVRRRSSNRHARICMMNLGRCWCSNPVLMQLAPIRGSHPVGRGPVQRHIFISGCWTCSASRRKRRSLSCETARQAGRAKSANALLPGKSAAGREQARRSCSRTASGDSTAAGFPRCAERIGIVTATCGQRERGRRSVSEICATAAGESGRAQ